MTDETQIRECPSCGKQSTHRRCGRCDDSPVTHPIWTVRDSRGRARGQVAGANHFDALESAAQSPAFDCLRAFTVTPTT